MGFIRWILTLRVLLGGEEEEDWVVFRRDLGIVYLIIVLREIWKGYKFEKLVYGLFMKQFCSDVTATD